MSKQKMLVKLLSDNPSRWFTLVELKQLLRSYSDESITNLVYHVRKKGHAIVCLNGRFKLVGEY